MWVDGRMWDLEECDRPGNRVSVSNDQTKDMGGRVRKRKGGILIHSKSRVG